MIDVGIYLLLVLIFSADTGLTNTSRVDASPATTVAGLETPRTADSKTGQYRSRGEYRNNVAENQLEHAVNMRVPVPGAFTLP